MNDTDDIPLLVGVDSYVSLDDANAIADKRLFATAWAGASEETQCRALQTATALLDRLAWKGRPVTPSQALAWPRVNERAPAGYPLNAPIPREIVTACVEWAIHLLTSRQLSDAPVQMRAVGDTSVMYFATPTVADDIPKHVRRLIQPHLAVTSANVAEVVF